MNAYRQALGVAGASLILAGSAWGCGLDWGKPHGHYDGVDEKGHVLLVDSLGELNLGSGEKLPLYTLFKSDWQNSSPYLGQGWMLALLDSRIMQEDDNTFLLWQPNGQYQHLGREKPEDTILNGQGGWKAVIEGNKITAWATCGWKLTYESGKITSITTPKNDELDMIYKNGRISDVQEKGISILSIDTDPNTGLTSGLTVNGKKIGLAQSDKPVVQTLGDKSVIGLMAPSLGKVTYPDGTTKNYQYKVNDKIEPQLIADGRTIQWNPASQLITRDGDWTYKIATPADSPLPQIARTNAKGQSESYLANPATGTTTIQTLDGIKTITATFVNAGPLTGHVRSVTQVKDGVSTVVQKYDYDEKGRMIREILGGSKSKDIIYKYDAQGNQTEIDLNGKLAVKNDYDAQGRLIDKTFSNGIKESYAYFADRMEQTTYLKNGETLVVRIPNIINGTSSKDISQVTAH